jgi:hypothetical protein
MTYVRSGPKSSQLPQAPQISQIDRQNLCNLCNLWIDSTVPLRNEGEGHHPAVIGVGDQDDAGGGVDGKTIGQAKPVEV